MTVHCSVATGIVSYVSSSLICQLCVFVNTRATSRIVIRNSRIHDYFVVFRNFLNLNQPSVLLVHVSRVVLSSVSSPYNSSLSPVIPTSLRVLPRPVACFTSFWLVRLESIPLRSSYRRFMFCYVPVRFVSFRFV